MNLVLFLPILFIISYTFNHVFPVLAMVEDDTPEYEAVPLARDDIAPADSSTVKPNATRLGFDNGPVTRSFRATNRLLRANGGFSAYFRGFFCLFAFNMAGGFLQGIFATAIAPIFASFALLVASLALVQLNTAWVHIIITPRSSAHFWKRLPPFRRTFNATALPTAIFWVALQVSNILPFALAYLMGMEFPDVTVSPGDNTDMPAYDAANTWKAVVIAIVTIAVSLFVLIPAQAVLVRVQASLLPESEDTIIAFDRSFRGAVLPTIVGGKGYATVTDAWKTFTASAWRRLLGLTVKIFFVNMAVMVAMAVVIAPQVYVIYSHSTLKEPSHGSS